MAALAAEPFPVLERQMFDQVLNIYVANTTPGFAAAALDLLAIARVCDFGIALLRRAASGTFVAYDSRGRTWDEPFVRLQAGLLGAISSHTGPDQRVLVADASAPPPLEEELARYRGEVLARIDSRHAALIFMGDTDAHPTLMISAHRAPGSAEFDSADVARLLVFRRYIENAWTLLAQRLLVRAMLDGISLAVRNYNVGVVMLDARLRVVWHNRAARGAVLAWGDGGHSELKPARLLAPLPPAIIAACERLRAEWQESTGDARLRRKQIVRHPAYPGRCALIRLCGSRLPGIAAPNFVIQFEHDTAAGHPAPHSLIHSLTPTEREVARLVCQGMSNQEIADALGKSVEAVKFHLHRMFKKAGVTTRSRLMLALG